MKEKAFEIAIAAMGIVSGTMAVFLATVFVPPVDAALYSTDDAVRAGINEAALGFFLGAAALAACFLFLHRPVKSA